MDKVKALKIVEVTSKLMQGIGKEIEEVLPTVHEIMGIPSEETVSKQEIASSETKVNSE